MPTIESIQTCPIPLISSTSFHGGIVSFFSTPPGWTPWTGVYYLSSTNLFCAFFSLRVCYLNASWFDAYYGRAWMFWITSAQVLTRRVAFPDCPAKKITYRASPTNIGNKKLAKHADRGEKETNPTTPERNSIRKKSLRSRRDHPPPTTEKTALHDACLRENSRPPSTSNKKNLNQPDLGLIFQLS